ncbi:MAG TPA: hypothetical protein VFZ53_24970 [Polyangiaceae bacterium]
MSNLTFIRALGGSLGEGHGSSSYSNTSGEQIVDNLVDFIAVPYRKTSADGMATTTTSDTQIGFINPFDFSIKLVSAFAVAVGGTLTAHDTNYATITLKFDDGAAGTPAVAATWTTTTTGTGNWAVGIREAATLTVANLTLVAGGAVWFNIAKAAAGVVVPTSDYYMRFRKLG